MKIEIWNREGRYLVEETTPDKYIESLNNLEFNASIDLHSAPRDKKRAVYAVEYYNSSYETSDGQGHHPKMVHLYSPALLLTSEEYKCKFQNNAKVKVFSVERAG